MDDNFKELRKYLIDLAIKGHADNYKTIVDYSDVDFVLSDDNSILTKYLTEILEFENQNNRPVITVFAILKETKLPKDFFFNLVRDKKIYPQYVQNNDIYRIERDASTEFWRNCDNFDKFYEV